MSGRAPAVSFIVPAFNAARTLRATLDSLAAQTFEDWEAIVIDDGSKDQTGAIASARSRFDPRIRVSRQVNQGASAARNRGITEARGGLIAFIDADDWIASDFLTQLVPLADEGRAVAYCAYRRILASGRESPVDWCPELESDPFGVLVKRCEPAIHCMLIPAPVLNQVGGFDVTLRTCEDWDLWLRIARTGIPFRGTPDPLASYRMRPFSLSTDKALNEDAGRVLTIARGPDSRVGDPDSRYAEGSREASEMGLPHVLAREVSAIMEMKAPAKDWIVTALGSDWRAVVTADPADIVETIEAAATATPDPNRVVDAMIDSVRALDMWIGDLLADWCHMGRVALLAGEKPGQCGRWLAKSVDLQRLPDLIEPPAGCDALLLVCAANALQRRQVALPLTRPIERHRLAKALLELWSLPELMRMMQVWRSPIFAGLLIYEAAGLAWRQGASVLSRPRLRSTAGTIMRRALARKLGVTSAQMPPLPTSDGGAAVLLFDRIVPGIAGVLDSAIGSLQILDLLDLLAAEGFTTVGLADLEAARRGAGTLPERPLILVFADAPSVLGTDTLQRLPDAFTTVEMLFDPDQIARGFPAEVVSAVPHVTIRGGLRVRRLPLASVAAIEYVAQWRAALGQQLGGEPPIGALCDAQGLPPAVLQEAGFKLVLAPGTGHARLDLPSPIIPALECCGSGGIGDVLENLRPAA